MFHCSFCGENSPDPNLIQRHVEASTATECAGAAVDLESESALFLEPQRYQLPIGRRQDTYAAQLAAPLAALALPAGRRVAVKGPFATQAKARVALTVTQLKRSCCATSSLDLALLPQCVLTLRADRFAESRARFGFDCSVPRYFLLSPDLTEAHWPSALPTTHHAPTTNFPHGLDVVDWAALRQRCGYEASVPWSKGDATYADSLYAQDPRAAQQLLHHVLINWVIGCGGDLALRNFLYPQRGAGRIYNVDTDNVGHHDWHLGNTQVANERLAMGRHFRTFFTEHADLQPLRAALQHLDYSLLPSDDARTVARHRAHLDKHLILALLSLKPKPPKSKPKAKSRDTSPSRPSILAQ